MSPGKSILFSIGLFLLCYIVEAIARRIVCFRCGAKKNSLVPLDTPEGERLLNQSKGAQKKQFEKGKLTSSVDKTREADIAAQLERLAKLKDKGVLTNKEFETQKTKLLSC